MNFRKNNSFLNLFDSLFSDKEKFESFYNQLTNKLTPSLGTTKTENGVNEDGSKWYKTTFSSNDGSYTYSTFVSNHDLENYSYSNSTKDVKNEVEVTELTKLNNQLNTAVETQNFEEAVKLRDLIKVYEKNSEKINELKTKLETAISTQNFEEAIKLRDSINKFENK